MTKTDKIMFAYEQIVKTQVSVASRIQLLMGSSCWILQKVEDAQGQKQSDAQISRTNRFSCKASDNHSIMEVTF